MTQTPENGLPAKSNSLVRSMGSSLTFIPPVIAHRGASAYAPENTFAALIKAAQLGIRWVEFDVMLTQDDELILFHDFNLDRTTNGKGWVAEYPYPYLQTLDAGMWFDPAFAGEKIPLLRDVLLFLKAAKMNANIEIKALEGDEERLVGSLAEMVKNDLGDPEISLLFSSFSLPAMYTLREHMPNCALGLLLDEWDPQWKKFCDELQCISVHTNYEILTDERAQQIKHFGKNLLCYTVNTSDIGTRLFTMGVDAVFSDAPDIIAAHL